ncbi:HAD-IA family hydrolase [Pseudofulvibacter geojedonensis]|uniref:HAD-IA family hydrolase n=1 Tax=Pseudofulvibacter geojedonensis TaxID=1123758 RepID=A0ABW3HYZ7_9FLAO
MIKNLLFDFGDVFINLDKQGAMQNALELFGIKEFSKDMIRINEQYEIGAISSEKFLEFYESKFPKLSRKEIINAWNYILKDFPIHRLAFIQQASKKYRCFLLSNTNEIHIDWIKNDWGIELYNDFKSCFEQFYLSHEIGFRKPNKDIYEFVLHENKLNASETLFIDDTKENTDAAKKIGFNIWNNDPYKQDVVNLFSIKKELF